MAGSTAITAAAAAPVKPVLMRSAPSESTQRAAQVQADALLGNNRQAQAAAGTTLALDAALAADTLPLVLQSTLDTLARNPGSADSRQAVASALRVLQSAGPSLLRAQAREVRRIVDAGRDFGGISAVSAGEIAARLDKAAQQKPFVYVQIADERQRTLARSVAARLASAGYSMPGIENVGPAKSPAATQIRSQGSSDPALARWMAKHLSNLLDTEVAVVTLRQAKPETDTYELWFDRELCVSAARTPPACQAR
jgi:hypothetical protein